MRLTNMTRGSKTLLCWSSWAETTGWDHGQGPCAGTKVRDNRLDPQARPTGWDLRLGSQAGPKNLLMALKDYESSALLQIS